MIDPFKIVVYSLKSVKWLPSVQNDSLVMNTLASLNSPVMNTQGSLDSPLMNTPWSRLLSVLWTSIRTGLHTNFLVNNRPGGQDFPVYISQGSLDSLVYFALAGSIVNQFRSAPRWWIHREVSTPRWWIRWGVMTPRWWIHWGVSTPQ